MTTRSETPAAPAASGTDPLPLIVDKMLPAGRTIASALLRHAPTLTLDWDARSRSRLAATDSAGRALAISLPRGSVMRDGAVLVARDGSLVQVRGAAQDVLVVRICPEHGAPVDLLRAAWHLGNRHVPLQVLPTELRLEPDAVLADMLRRQHLIVTPERQAFDPEGGAYAEVAGHAHAGQGNAHGHAHAHEPERAHAHVHGPGCAHEHGDQADHEGAQVHGRDPGRRHDHGHGHEHANDPHGGSGSR